MLVFHLLLIHFREWNNITTIAKTCEQKKKVVLINK